jgi:hypothetical protein
MTRTSAPSAAAAVPELAAGAATGAAVADELAAVAALAAGSREHPAAQSTAMTTKLKRALDARGAECISVNDTARPAWAPACETCVPRATAAEKKPQCRGRQEGITRR